MPEPVAALYRVSSHKQVIDPTAKAVGLQQRKPYYDQPECRT